MRRDKEPDDCLDQMTCSCGGRLEPLDPDDPCSEMTCPQCGASFKTDAIDLSCADTQTLNIREMARMAQEGVDPTSVSGEWITILEHEPGKGSDKDR